MNKDKIIVELMGSESCSYLADVYDTKSQTFYFPQTLKMQFDPLSLIHDVKKDATAIAFLDSGMLTAHPVIRSRLKHSVDFTGEGSEDLNGHGTLVTLLGLSESPYETAVVNVKVLNRLGEGKMSWLVKGLEWCTINAKQYNIKVVNLSAGIYSKKWGFLECNSDCSVCKAARSLHMSGVQLVVAAGNDGANMLPCPQKIGILENTFLVVEVATKDYSGRGNVAEQEIFIKKIPLK
jgi:serine protease AprX